MSSRNLNVITTMTKIAQVVTTVIDDLKRIHASDELAEIFQKGQSAVDTVVDAAQAASDDVQDIVVLALQIYESLQRQERSLDRPLVGSLAECADRDDVINYVVAHLGDGETV